MTASPSPAFSMAASTRSGCGLVLCTSPELVQSSAGDSRLSTPHPGSNGTAVDRALAPLPEPRTPPMSTSAATESELLPAPPPARRRGADGCVHLTFDDGPDPRFTPQILDALEAEGARVTFFVIAGRQPDLVRAIAARGHEVGYHCGEHVRHSRRRRSEVGRELRSDLQWLSQCGVAPRAWRTPWGDLAPWTGDLAREAGLQLWGWSDDTEDWAGRTSTQMLEGLEQTVSGGSVVLMHDGLGPGATRAGCEQTAALVAPLCRLARSLGLRIAPLPAGWEA